MNWNHLAREKLERIFGPFRADEILAEALAALGLREVTSVDELARVAEHLAKQSGFVGIAGTALRTFAALRGAKADPSAG